MSKVPKWFEDFLDNDYKHLENDVRGIKKDLNFWIKPLLLLILSALIAGAVIIVAVG